MLPKLAALAKKPDNWNFLGKHYRIDKRYHISLRYVYVPYKDLEELYTFYENHIYLSLTVSELC